MKIFIRRLTGVLIVIFLIARYGDGQSAPRSLLSFLITGDTARFIVAALLLIVAFAITAEPRKDYAPAVYSWLVKIFGVPEKAVKSK